MKKVKLNLLAAAILGTGLTLSLASVAGEQSSAPSKPQAQSETVKSVQSKVDAEAGKQAEEKRKVVMQDAVVALKETQNALKLLEANKPKEALAALEKVTGKLELILARDPELALAPVDVEAVTRDLLADIETVKAMIYDAREYLDDGEIQKARPIIANLASEIVIRSANIPLGTYPDAIKAIVPLIDQGKLDEAKAALQDVLHTLVVVNEGVIPLPVVRAEMLLDAAEKLAEKEKRTDEENKKVSSLLDEAGKQLKLADLLGYGDRDAYKSMYQELDRIAGQVSGGEGGKGWFDKIRKEISDLL